MEDGRTYEQAVEMAIQDKEIPDVLVVKGLDTLKQLVERGMVEDLSSVYEECTTDRIKECMKAMEQASWTRLHLMGSYTHFQIR